MKLIETTAVPIESLNTWDTASKLFARYTPEEYSDLSEYCRRHGVDSILPLVVDEKRRIVDGYNRFEAAKQRGDREVPVQVFAYTDDAEMEAHAIVLNAKRRHLDSITAARAARRLAELDCSAEEANRRRSEAAKGNTNAAKDKAHENSGVPGGLPLSRRKRTGVSRLRRAAKRVGVSHNTATQVAKVDRSGDAELVRAMEERVVPIATAAKLADAEPEVRAQVLQEARAAAEAPQAVAGVLHNEGDAGLAPADLRAMAEAVCRPVATGWRTMPAAALPFLHAELLRIADEVGRAIAPAAATAAGPSAPAGADAKPEPAAPAARGPAPAAPAVASTDPVGADAQAEPASPPAPDPTPTAPAAASAEPRNPVEAFVLAVRNTSTYDISQVIPDFDDRRDMEIQLGMVRHDGAAAVSTPEAAQRVVEALRPHRHLALLQPLWKAAGALPGVRIE